LVYRDVLPFNSDEAIVALMARHILQGERPIFFYGQAYMGSLDTWLVAFGFWVFGEYVWVIRFVQGVLYLGVMLTTYMLGFIALGSRRVGLVAIWLLAIPNVIVTLYTTVSLGGYGEGLLLGNIILLLGLQIAGHLKENIEVKSWHWLLWGILIGFGLWVFGISLVFSIPMGLFLATRLWQRNPKAIKFFTAGITWKATIFTCLGILVGAISWWLYAIQNGFTELLSELGGSAVAVEQGPWLLRTGQHLVRLILFGTTGVFGMRPSWEIRWLAVPLLPIALVFWMAVLVHIYTRFKSGMQNKFGAGVLVGIILFLSLGFIFTSFGVDPSGRYFVPLVIPLSLFAGEMIVSLLDRYGRLVYGFVGVILIYNTWGIFQSAARVLPGITTQFDQITQVDHRAIEELIRFLEEQGETRGYTNYWVAYPLAFLSQEELIFIPRLPYHEDFRYTPRDDRYSPYDEAVENTEKVAYITTHHPYLEQYLRDAFLTLDLTWQERQIGDYYVFYCLSAVVRPGNLGLELTEP
jgi:hypothetical protein